MLLASYVAGLIGVPGRQVRYASPVSVETIRIAVSVQEAERQEKFNNNFYVRHDSRSIATAISRDTRSLHVRPAKKKVDARRFHGVPTIQEHRALRTRRPSLPYAVTNAKV